MQSFGTGWAKKQPMTKFCAFAYFSVGEGANLAQVRISINDTIIKRKEGRGGKAAESKSYPTGFNCVTRHGAWIDWPFDDVFFNGLLVCQLH